MMHAVTLKSHFNAHTFEVNIVSCSPWKKNAKEKLHCICFAMNDSINSFIKNYLLHNRISTFLFAFSFFQFVFCLFFLCCSFVQNSLSFALTICCIWLDSVSDRRISFHFYRNNFIPFTFLSQSLSFACIFFVVPF